MPKYYKKSQRKYFLKHRDEIKVSRKDWRSKNAEKCRQYQRNYRKSHLEHVKQYEKNWRKNHPENMREMRRKARKKKLPHDYFQTYKASAKRRKHCFELSYEEFYSLISKPCHYCGFFEFRNGVDRKDNTIGYLYSNCLPCCQRCNFFKRNKKYDSFVKSCIDIGTYLSKIK